MSPMSTPNGTPAHEPHTRTSTRPRPFVAAPGTVVAGRYRLEKLLGKGGMGEVWLAKHTELDTPFAVKFLEKSLLQDDDRETTLQRFRDEAKITSSLAKRTRHIVAVTDYGDIAGLPFLVMEVLEGRSLEDVVTTKALAPEDALVLLRQVARGLAPAHEAGLIHRDLKPANIFLCKDEDGAPLAKVLDFGLVRPVVSYDRKATQKGIAVGTPSYMSPEQARASADIDHRADVWSLGVVAYAMLTGKEPWPGDTAQEVLVNVCRSEYVPASTVSPTLGTRFDPLFERAFRRHADDRFQSAEAFVEAFGRACSESPADVPGSRSGDDAPAGETARLVAALPGTSRSRGPMLGGLVLAALLLTAFVATFGRRSSPPATSAVGQPASANMPLSGPPRGSATEPAPLVAPEDLPPADPKASAPKTKAQTPTPTPKGQGPKVGAMGAAEPPTVTPAAVTPPTVTPAATQPSDTKPAAPPPKPHDRSAVF